MILKSFPKNALAFVFVFFQFAIFSHLNAAVSVRADVDKNEGTLEDNFVLQIQVEGGKPDSEPVLNTNDFDVEGRGTSSSIQIINMKMSSKMTYSYALYPKREGEFHLDKMQIKADGREVPINEIVIKVTKNPRQSGQSGQAGRGGQSGQITPGEVGQSKSGRKALFVTASVSNPSPYVNEQIVWTFDLYFKNRISNLEFTKPDFKDLWVEDLGKERSFSKVVDGVEYNVVELKIALFPGKSGIVEIPSARLDCTIYVQERQRRGTGGDDSLFDDFFNNSFFGFGQAKRVRLKTDPIKINVKPIPPSPTGQTRDVLVGEYTLKAHLSSDRVAVGDSTTYTAEIVGTGNMRDIKIPDIDGSDIFKVYDDSPELKLNRDGDILFGQKIFKKAIVPLKQENFEIPPVKLSFFNPKTGRFEETSSKPMMVKVLPGTLKENLDITKGQYDTEKRQKRVDLLKEDILPAKTELGPTGLIGTNSTPAGLWIFILVLPPFFYFGFMMLLSRRRRMLSNKDKIRSSRAYGTFKKDMKKLGTLPAGSSKEVADNLSRLINRYLSDRFKLEGGLVTAIDVDTKLCNRLDAVLCGDLKKLLEELDSLRYGAGSSTTAKMTERTLETVRKIEQGM